MTVRRIIITDHSPGHGDMPSQLVLEIEIKGNPEYLKIVTDTICYRFKDKLDHSLMVEDISSIRNEVLSLQAWRPVQKKN